MDNRFFMAFTLGIDVGSGYTKAVVCEDGRLRSYRIVPSGGNYNISARAVADEALRNAGLMNAQITFTTATGYGAAMVDFADRTATDIVCHAAGVHLLLPSVMTVVDIGAQFSKAIKLDEQGRVANFVMNEKCAGGSGKFLQLIARILHIDISEIGRLSLDAVEPVDFTTSCAVFAESEAVSRIAEGASPADILAGVHKAMAAKIINLVTRVGFKEDIAITGGGAKDTGLVKTLETELGARVLVTDEPQVTAALGACLLGGSIACEI
jgi:(R)-2-hydroxyacyl-CoA dehydratese activating ATPase